MFSSAVYFDELNSSGIFPQNSLWIYEMEQSFDFIVDEDQPPLEESSYFEDDEEEEYIPRKSRLVKPWYMRSRKSIVRMIGSNLVWQSNDRIRRRFRDRSIVRMIASRLPLKPSRRAYFEIFVESNRAVMSKAKDFIEENFNNVKSQLPELGLADMGLLTWNDFEVDPVDNKPGVITRNALESSSLSLSSISNVSSEDVNSLQPRCLKRGKKMREKESSEKKITALEDELANLRAQIAAIVSLQDKASQPHIPMAPPPPPPPKTSALLQPPSPAPQSVPKQPSKMQIANSKAVERGVPSMTQVLAGLSNVKLKSANIARSPGGTPLKVRSNIPNESSHDPADVIANALRRKFSKARRSIGSPCADKENQWSPHGGFSPSPIKNADISGVSPITSSPEKSRKSRRRSSKITGGRILLSPVTEN